MTNAVCNRTTTAGFRRALFQTSLAAAALAIAAPATVLAQSGGSGASEAGAIEEIIVTAKGREQALQEVPMAVSAFSGDDLEALLLVVDERAADPGLASVDPLERGLGAGIDLPNSKVNKLIVSGEPAGSIPAVKRMLEEQWGAKCGDTAGMTPLVKMHTLGHAFIPDPIHAGGLRYHGMSPLLSHIYEEGLMTARAVAQTECFDVGVLFARTEGIVPAPEPTHALAEAVREAKACAETGEEKVIVTALCGHGLLDLPAYDSYLSGRMVDEDVTEDRLAAGLATLP